MKNVTKLASTAMAGALILLSGCCRTGDKNGVVNPLDERDGSFYINASINPLRMADDAWAGGDALGVFALEKGANTLFGNFANVKYTTPDVSGKFVAADGGIVLKGSETADIVAYYPYNSAVGKDLVYPINVADQTDLSKIDLLRGKTANITAETKEAQMAFDHKLALLNLTMTGNNLTNVTASVDGLKTDGSYNIATDEVTPGNTTGKTTAALKDGKIRMILVPGQELKAITFSINGKEVTHTFDTPVALQKGYKYSLKFEVGSAGETLKISSTNINPWTEGITDGGTITLPLDETGGETGGEEPTPEPTPTSKLLFPGSDFEDWAAFKAGLNSFGLKSYAVESTDAHSGSTAMHIKGTPTGNDYVFTATVPSGATTNITKIRLFIKGTAGKSLSFNVYSSDKVYKAFNLGDVTAAKESPYTISAAANNQYGGTIDTGGEWKEIVIDCSDAEIATSGNLFALKVGKEVAYDLLVDDITFE